MAVRFLPCHELIGPYAQGAAADDQPELRTDASVNRKDVGERDLPAAA